MLQQSQSVDPILQSTQSVDPIPQSTQSVDPIPQSTQSMDPILQSTQSVNPILQSTQSVDPIPQSTQSMDPILQSTQSVDLIIAGGPPTFQTSRSRFSRYLPSSKIPRPPFLRVSSEKKIASPILPFEQKNAARIKTFVPQEDTEKARVGGLPITESSLLPKTTSVYPFWFLIM
ncbi:hypothetical protein CDAR_182271 [Caerostris darwini]|uniref:Uncharacterized protein n=1 Tax=Caerostris darwini TaxID=1538125 RepID=A0AAV4U5N2_9ARAC|nr:hypothetical protein CDAR_182271 [Caerostris darwini]